jgi:hypothetical protein
MADDNIFSGLQSGLQDLLPNKLTYATPDQIKAIRGAGQSMYTAAPKPGIYTWGNAVGDIASKMMGGYMMRRAGEIQKSGLEKGAEAVSSFNPSAAKTAETTDGGGVAGATEDDGSAAAGSPEPYGGGAPAVNAADISARLETGSRNPMISMANISPDTGGSKSYGSYGLNSQAGYSAHDFKRDYGEKLGLTATPGTPEFDDQWRQSVVDNPVAHRAAEVSWYNKNISSGIPRKLERVGVGENVASDPRVTAYFADRVVQQGAGSVTSPKHAARIQAAYEASGEDPVGFIKAMSAADRTPEALMRDFPHALASGVYSQRGHNNRVMGREALSLGLPMPSGEVHSAAPSAQAIGPMVNAIAGPSASAQPSGVPGASIVPYGTSPVSRDMGTSGAPGNLKQMLTAIGSAGPSGAPQSGGGAPMPAGGRGAMAGPEAMTGSYPSWLDARMPQFSPGRGWKTGSDTHPRYSGSSDAETQLRSMTPFSRAGEYNAAVHGEPTFITGGASGEIAPSPYVTGAAPNAPAIRSPAAAIVKALTGAPGAAPTGAPAPVASPIAAPVGTPPSLGGTRSFTGPPAAPPAAVLPPAGPPVVSPAAAAPIAPPAVAAPAAPAVSPATAASVQAIAGPQGAAPHPAGASAAWIPPTLPMSSLPDPRKIKAGLASDIPQVVDQAKQQNEYRIKQLTPQQFTAPDGSIYIGTPYAGYQKMGLQGMPNFVKSPFKVPGAYEGETFSTVGTAPGGGVSLNPVPTGQPAGAAAPTGVAPGGGLPPMPSTSDISGMAAWGTQVEAAKKAAVTTAEERAKGFAEPVNEAVKKAANGYRVLNSLDMMEEAYRRGGVSGGPLGPFFQDAKGALSQFGINLHGVAEGNIIEKINTGLSFDMAKELGSSRVAASEIVMGIRATPGLLMNNKASMYLMDIRRQQTKQDMELGKIAANLTYTSKWLEVKEKYLADNPLISPLTGKPIQHSKVDAQRELGALGAVTGVPPRMPESSKVAPWNQRDWKVKGGGDLAGTPEVSALRSYAEGATAPPSQADTMSLLAIARDPKALREFEQKYNLPQGAAGAYLRQNLKNLPGMEP